MLTDTMVEDFVPLPGHIGFEVNSQGLVRRCEGREWTPWRLGRVLVPHVAFKRSSYNIEGRKIGVARLVQGVFGCKPLEHSRLSALAERHNEQKKEEYAKQTCEFICRDCGQAFRLDPSYAQRIHRGERPARAGQYCSDCLAKRDKTPRRPKSRLTHRRCRICGRRLPTGYYMYCPAHHMRVSEIYQGPYERP